MATFKVGQRVRKIAYYRRNCPLELVPVGAEGTIVGTDTDYQWRVVYDNFQAKTHGCYFADSFMLAPITDPEADSWAADAVRKVTKPEPVAPKVPEKVSDATTMLFKADGIWALTADGWIRVGA
jgi:hypothetical protein